MKRIIIVDDDPAILEAFHLILGRAGYSVSSYVNGQVLLTLPLPPVDLILLDKQLSGADGLDICQRLKQQPETKHIPIVMLSASPHVRPLAMNACADDFLEKPFRMKDLLEMVKKHIGMAG
ncbi:response regulator transcription factor [Paraflavitalea pollutisoli]|uniref:response regulator transcription factor n=1 Tax=Paraflavitalea pollutisoli TaxID=3034143 RepID=UPI0023EC8DE9|nr:response regulator [Paraflavitalea sp. H1-2-19X]